MSRSCLPRSPFAISGALVVAAALLALPACRRHLKTQSQGRASKQERAKAQPASQTPAPVEKVSPNAVDLFAFGRQLGAIAPCGCTADPLGGLQYAFGYIDTHSRAKRRLLLQGGSFLFPDPQGPNAAKQPAEWGQIQQRAKLLTSAFTAFGSRLHLGLGPTDYSSPDGGNALTKYAAPRVSANLPLNAAPQLKAWRSVELAPGISAALTHIIDPALKSSAMPQVQDPAAALGSLLPKMRGHDLTIVTIQSRRPFAEALIRKVPGIDIAVVTGPIDDLEQARLGASPGLVNKTWLVQPGDQAQTMSHLRLFLPKALLAKARAHPTQDHIGPASDWALLASKTQRQAEIARLQKRLKTFEKDPDADASFLARMRADLKTLNGPVPLPQDQVALRIEAAKVSCHGTADPVIEKKLADYDAWVSMANKKRFTGVFAPKPKPGRASYVGDRTCRTCHAQAYDFWGKTHHAAAFATLEKANKHFDLNCVSCHVTGYGKPGGSELVENHKLRNVQCEQCHGPGSIHAKTANKAAIQRKVPETLCKGCHTPEHSDTFQYQAYLRDVLGAGHGEAARKALGPGPTGRSLRAAALKKAGGSCK